MNFVLKEEVGYITVSFYRYTYFLERGERDSTGGNGYCSIIGRSVGADVSFYNRFGMRADVMILQGAESAKVSVADVYKMFPFDNHVYCFELTMEEFKTLLEYSLTEGRSQLFTMMGGD